mmetsp:Transcript_2644/g.5928  ORF Transcript_2644/g.5928 Transcript_2644/m.5928 type:complete len:219 (+) Transcript_2644:800-1456(+)
MKRLISRTMRAANTIFSATIFRTAILRKMALTEGYSSSTASMTWLEMVYVSENDRVTARYPRCRVFHNMSSPSTPSAVLTTPLQITTPCLMTNSLLLSSSSLMISSPGGYVSRMNAKLSSMLTPCGMFRKNSTLDIQVWFSWIATSPRMLGLIICSRPCHDLKLVVWRRYRKKARRRWLSSWVIFASLMNVFNESISSWNSVSLMFMLAMMLQMEPTT